MIPWLTVLSSRFLDLSKFGALKLFWYFFLHTEVSYHCATYRAFFSGVKDVLNNNQQKRTTIVSAQGGRASFQLLRKQRKNLAMHLQLMGTKLPSTALLQVRYVSNTILFPFKQFLGNYFANIMQELSASSSKMISRNLINKNVVFK